MDNPPVPSPSDESTIKILLSTDNHLGYNENDGVRGRDSFRSFEEMLAIGVKNKVDFVLLAGDLFHHNKPSRATLYRTMSLLRNYCLGDGAINFQILSDQSLNFPNFGCVNYEDPNINVRLPVFSIHGNHDDPTGEAGRSLAALDLLSAANLVNYFGKSDRVDEIEVFPILLEKGSTKLAIYGLGNMRDERLHRMFSQGNVRFRRPEENPESWFSIFVVHQNRDNRGRGAKNCLPESFIPDFIDFVMWGHEHECLIEVEESIKGNFFITQPGSSVATSLIEGEAKPKKVGILEVNGNNFRLRSIPLKTVRPFKMAEVFLRDHKHLDPHDPNVDEKISALLAAKVQEMIDGAAVEFPAHASEPSMQVLVRIKVEHSGFPLLSNQRFGGQFVGKVANPGDILLFTRQKGGGDDSKKSSSSLRDPIRPGPPPASILGVEQLLSEHLTTSDRKLEILPETNMAHALEEFVFKNVSTAFGDIYDTVLKETQGVLRQNKSASDKTDILELVEKHIERQKVSQAARASDHASATNEVMRMLQAPDAARSDDDANIYPDDEDDAPPPSKPPRPSARKPSPKKPARNRHVLSDNEDDDDDDVQIVQRPSKTTTSRRQQKPTKQQYLSDEEVDSGSDYDTAQSRSTPKRKAPAKKPAASRRKRDVDDSPTQNRQPKKKAMQTTISNLFSQTSQLPMSSSWREAPTQPTVSQSNPGRRKLPLSFSSYTQDDEDAPKSSAATSSVAKGWGRARK
ncbi:Double-strand break repair protein mre11a [Aphanomyces cochlioides]|nr:Double-strand break repair protein mre11a [Aphanomyces cochlioides]